VPNIALNLAPFGRWTLRDKAAQRRLALRCARNMRIAVTKVERSEDGGSCIMFDCPVGKCYASWCGAYPPEVREYSVEIDINVKLSKTHVVASLPDRSKRLLRDKGTVCLFGELEHMAEDGMCYLRLHESCIIMVECEVPHPEVGTNVCMTLSPKDIEVTPIGY
jgi:hypothetical protein